ncbi:MAG: serine/threonine-protein phosphatase [Planctomycetaceae bacterium]|nr:serine/threonine-protein phosphatase [Planctomycetaceae bacterium]
MPDQMQCMEVWGGNFAVEREFQTSGLDVWLYSQPHLDHASGGDVYYLSSCASGRITRLLLADVSGHGAEVADSASQLRDLMRRHVNSISQTRFVEGLNEEFSRISDEGRFATAVVGTFFTLSGRFQLCQAGHPAPLLYRRRMRNWEVCDLDGPNTGTAPRNTPIGIIERVEYVQTELPLDTGDLLFAYTDGLSESRDRNDQLLGTAGLLKLLRSLDQTAPEGLLTALLTRLRERGYSWAADDFTLLLIRANGTHPSWSNKLLAPLRLLRRVRDVTAMDG